MQGDIAFAGFMMTAEEWVALVAPSLALLLAIVATSRLEPDLAPAEEPWVVVPLSDVDSQPIHRPTFAEGSGGVRSR
jgi:hypothetical protein